ATRQLGNSATRQLGNSATRQLGNSATRQLGNSATSDPPPLILFCKKRVKPPLKNVRLLFFLYHLLSERARSYPGISARHFQAKTQGARSRETGASLSMMRHRHCGATTAPLAAKQSSRGRQSSWIASPFGFAMTKGHRHCEAQSNEAIQPGKAITLDCFTLRVRNDEGARSQ
ncbi:MAG: hypothetical protein LBT00_15665, partial [Spirochaetaceae bacterium]|nr:hypothetical protein [Spirochaetaceae bacterium]